MIREKQVSTMKSVLYTPPVYELEYTFRTMKLHTEVGNINLNALRIHSEIPFRCEKNVSSEENQEALDLSKKNQKEKLKSLKILGGKQDKEIVQCIQYKDFVYRVKIDEQKLKVTKNVSNTRENTKYKTKTMTLVEKIARQWKCG